MKNKEHDIEFKIFVDEQEDIIEEVKTEEVKKDSEKTIYELIDEEAGKNSKWPFQTKN